MSMWRTVGGAAVWLALLGSGVGCGGSDGNDGDPGPSGPTGPTGPTGPLGAPPHLTGVSPSWGSALTKVTIQGENFSATAEDDTVLFQGFPASVLSASATELVVQLDVAVDELTPGAINVEVADQVSNALLFELVPSGSSRPLDVPLPHLPTSVVQLGGVTYVAAGGGAAPSSGLYRIDPDGYASRVLAGAPYQAGGTTLYDGPIALAVDGDALYFTTQRGAVDRYLATDGSVTEVVASPFPFAPGGAPSAIGLAVIDGDIFVAQRAVYGGAVEYFTAAAGFGLAATGLGDDLAGLTVRPIGATVDAFVTRHDNGTVTKISDVGGLDTVTASWVTGVPSAGGIALVGTDLRISDGNGIDHHAATSSGAATNLTGKLGVQTGLWVNAGGDTFGASGLEVRELPMGAPDTVLLASGLPDLDWAATSIGDTIYVGGTIGSFAPSNVVQLTADGRSRPFDLQGVWLRGNSIAPGATGELLVADCGAQEVERIDLATGDITTLLDAADGLVCPTSVYRDSGGTVFYVDMGTQKIGRLTSAGTHTPDFADLAGVGNEYYWLGASGADLLIGRTLAFDPTLGFIARVSATSGGVASYLVPPGLAGPLFSITRAGDGQFLIGRGTAELDYFDPTSGALTPLDTLPTGQPAALVSLPNGTIVATMFSGEMFRAIAP